jgi:hypothetical protein
MGPIEKMMKNLRRLRRERDRSYSKNTPVGLKRKGPS